ncbi:MAG: hypothetical protein USCAAHI_00690 [Beijerinckiaceae bacterium]|nr:MAG: hypothetical protein USCAAHI_00690 [Beijerinckiaceae bacterium]
MAAQRRIGGQGSASLGGRRTPYCFCFRKRAEILSDAPEILASLALPLVQPNFCTELGGIVHAEILIKLFGEIRDR